MSNAELGGYSLFFSIVAHVLHHSCVPLGAFRSAGLRITAMRLAWECNRPPTGTLRYGAVRFSACARLPGAVRFSACARLLCRKPGARRFTGHRVRRRRENTRVLNWKGRGARG